MTNKKSNQSKSYIDLDHLDQEMEHLHAMHWLLQVPQELNLEAFLEE